MQDKSKHGFTMPNQDANSIRRQDSMITKMSIFGNQIYQRLPSQQMETPNIPKKPQYVHREQTHANVFKGFKKQQPQKIVQNKVVSPQSYQRQCLQYEKYLFDHRIKNIIKRMAIKAYSTLKNQKEGQFLAFPLQRLLIAIAKKLLLNRFELLFLQYVFEETKWRYDSQCIHKHAHHFKSYIMLPDSQSFYLQIKLVQVFILYCAYFSKKSLNQLPPDNYFITFCQQICPRFKDFFPEWTQNYQMGARINTKNLNNIFRRLTYNFEKGQQQFQNYCLMVEQIIEISPAYNSDKTGKPKKTKKNKKQQQNKDQHNEESHMRNQRQQESHQQLPDIIHQEQSLDIQPPMFKNKKSSILSVDLLEANHYLTRSASQHQRK